MLFPERPASRRGGQSGGDSSRALEGVDNPVDAVLVFNVITYIKQADLQPLFQLLAQCLAPNGIVIIVSYCRQPESTRSFWHVMERLGKPREAYYEHVYSPYRQKHTKYTKDSTQIHKNQVHKKDKTEKQSISQ